MATPSTSQAIDAARVAREGGKLKVALRALDHAYSVLDKATPQDERRRLAQEGDAAARALMGEGATLAALGEWQRARVLGSADARAGAIKLATDYARWRPAPRKIGAPKDALLAAATGAFWVAPGVRGRVLVLEGGITGEGTESFGRVLTLSAQDAGAVLVDMERLTYVGSAGLAVAVKVAERLRQSGGGLTLFAMSSNLKLLVETLGLAGFLNPAATVNDALESFCRG